MQNSYIGSTSASQAEKAGSIPVFCSIVVSQKRVDGQLATTPPQPICVRSQGFGRWGNRVSLNDKTAGCVNPAMWVKILHSVFYSCRKSKGNESGFKPATGVGLDARYEATLHE